MKRRPGKFVRTPIALMLTLWLCGCAASARNAAPEEIVDAAESTGGTADEAALPATVDPAPVAAAPPVASPPVAPPPSGSPTGSPRETSPTIATEQEVGVKLDAASRADLAAQATKDLAEAQAAISALPRASAGEEKRQKIEVVESLIQAARAAYESDVAAAAALAHKARLLAVELGPG